MARRRARGRRRRAVRGRRDPPPRRSAAARRSEMAIDADLAAGRHAEVDQRARPAGRRASAARAPAPPADARAVPRRPPVGGARRLPGRARPRSSSRSASSRAPSCGRCTSGPGARIRRSTSPQRRSPLRRWHRAPPPQRRRAGCSSPRPPSSSPASRRSASSGCSSPKGCPASARTRWASSISNGCSHHRAVPGRPRSGRRRLRRRLGVGGEPARRHRLAGRRPARAGRHDPRRRRARRARVRRRLAVGGRRRRPRRRPDRSRIQQVLQRIAAANAPKSLAVAAGALWVVSGADGSVRRIEIRRGASRQIPLGAKATAVAAGAGAIWVTSEEAGTVARVDPARAPSSPRSTSATGRPPSRRARARCGSSNRGDGTLSRVDPASERGVVDRAVGRDPRAVAVGEEGVGGGRGGRHRRPRRPRGRRVLRGCTPAAARRACGRGGSVWTAATAPAAAHRGGTLRVISPYPGRPRELAERARLVRRDVDAGLAGLRRPVATGASDGIAGATLVGALATRPPPPSPDGRTYVFTLRAGLRYSDGSAGAAGRLPRVDGALPARHRQGVSPRTSRDRRRAGVHARGRPRCDLSRGIESDAHRHDHRPPHSARTRSSCTSSRCRWPTSCPPARPRAGGCRPHPGPGPYRIAAGTSPRRGSSATRASARPPPGPRAYRSDRGRGSTRGERERTSRRSSAATADVLVLFPPFSSIITRTPQGRSSPAPGQCTAPRPSGHVGVPERPARRRSTTSASGARSTSPSTAPRSSSSPAVRSPLTRPARSCRSGFPAFDPYCPYTADPVRAAGGPRPTSSARAVLIAASGQAGAARDRPRARGQRSGRALLRVVASRPRLPRDGARCSRLRRLRHGDRRPVRASRWASRLGPDYMSASTLIEADFACTPRGPGRQRLTLCDAAGPAFDRARAATRARSGGLGRGRSPSRRPRAGVP